MIVFKKKVCLHSGKYLTVSTFLLLLPMFPYTPQKCWANMLTKHLVYGLLYAIKFGENIAP